MEDPSYSETVVHSQQTTCCHVSEDRIPQQYQCQKTGTYCNMFTNF